MKFIDHVKINVKAGDGGHGCIAFLREKFRPKGGPCGGDGGNGGNVVLRVNPQLSTLHDISYNRHYRAGKGQHGQGKHCHGKNGEDLIIDVPPGTIVKNSDTNQVLVDLTENESSFIIVNGGNGGFGNARFKTKTQTAPRIANDGQPGEQLLIDLELKVLADVGLVGFPNAGKSTFISRISNAKPRIADYPFTTLVPNLGIVKYHDYNSFVMADIPGLIEGAADGKGLGSRFLKHIERTKILVFIVDINSEDINAEYSILRNELDKFGAGLNARPSILLVSKYDVENEELLKELNLPKDIPYVIMSSVTGTNLTQTKNKIIELIESQKNDTQASTD